MKVVLLATAGVVGSSSSARRPEMFEVVGKVKMVWQSLVYLSVVLASDYPQWGVYVQEHQRPFNLELPFIVMQDGDVEVLSEEQALGEAL